MHLGYFLVSDWIVQMTDMKCNAVLTSVCDYIIVVLSENFNGEYSFEYGG